MNTSSSDGALRPGEIGLLTIAERRGSVRNPVEIDSRSDVAAIERQTLLDGLVALGLMLEAEREDGERVFKITEQGCAALAEHDGRRI